MEEEIDAFLNFALSKTEAPLIHRPSARLSTEAFVSILDEEVSAKSYSERLFYRNVLAGLERQLPVIMSRSLRRLDTTPTEVWAAILDEIFADRVLVSWRRGILTDKLFIRVAGQNYQLNLNDGGPTSILETLTFPDPPPVLSFANPWPTEEKRNKEQ